MRLLIDANIILDVLQDRAPHVRDSALIWKLCETERAEGFISALTFANLVYILRKSLSPQLVYDLLRQLKLIFRIADLGAEDLERAAALTWDDYEDAIQAVTAQRLRADYIITRNIGDFTESPIPAVTPAAFLGMV